MECSNSFPTQMHFSVDIKKLAARITFWEDQQPQGWRVATNVTSSVFLAYCGISGHVGDRYLYYNLGICHLDIVVAAAL